MDQITIGMIAPAFLFYPVWVAQTRGFFTAHDIESRTELYGTTDRVTSALVNNNCQIGMVTPEGTIANAVNGGPLRLVAGNANRAPLSLIGQKGIARIADLRGKRVGTSSLKEGTAVIVQKMLAAHGLHYPGDYEFALVGAHPQRWEHLQRGTIDAGLQLLPLNYVAEEAGFPNLGEASDYVPDYAFMAIGVNLTWAEPNRELAVRTIAALREAVEWTFDHPDEAAEILATATGSTSVHSRRGISEMTNSGVSPKDLRINRKALDAVFAAMHEVELIPSDVALSYDSVVDESFLESGR